MATIGKTPCRRALPAVALQDRAVDDPSDAVVDEWDEKHEAFHAALLSGEASPWLLPSIPRSRISCVAITVFSAWRQRCGRPPGLQHGYEEAVEALRQAVEIEHHTALMEAALDSGTLSARKP